MKDKYIVVSTLCNRKEIADQIIETLLQKRLVASCQVYDTLSKYWWKEKIEEEHEYLILMRSRESLYPDIESEIKKVHDYEIAEISYWEIKGGSQDFFNWIDYETK